MHSTWSINLHRVRCKQGPSIIHWEGLTTDQLPGTHHYPFMATKHTVTPVRTPIISRQLFFFSSSCQIISLLHQVLNGHGFSDVREIIPITSVAHRKSLLHYSERSKGDWEEDGCSQKLVRTVCRFCTESYLITDQKQETITTGTFFFLWIKRSESQELQVKTKPVSLSHSHDSSELCVSLNTHI